MRHSSLSLIDLKYNVGLYRHVYVMMCTALLAHLKNITFSVHTHLDGGKHF